MARASNWGASGAGNVSSCPRSAFAYILRQSQQPQLQVSYSHTDAALKGSVDPLASKKRLDFLLGGRPPREAASTGDRTFSLDRPSARTDYREQSPEFQYLY